MEAIFDTGYIYRRVQLLLNTVAEAVNVRGSYHFNASFASLTSEEIANHATRKGHFIVCAGKPNFKDEPPSVH